MSLILSPGFVNDFSRDSELCNYEERGSETTGDEFEGWMVYWDFDESALSSECNMGWEFEEDRLW